MNEHKPSLKATLIDMSEITDVIATKLPTEITVIWAKYQIDYDPDHGEG